MKNLRFEDMALEASLLKALSGLGYHSPTPVQEQVIPALMNNQSIIVKSKTGSGKTAAFGIPMIHKIDWDIRSPQVLVLTPTRELADQVKTELFNVGRFKRIKVVSVYGKSPMKSQIRALHEKTHIVVGTPGRLLDHLDRGTLNLSEIKYLVLDEADEMLNMGFLEDVETIMKKCPRDIVKALLSATMPDAIRNLCDAYMASPVFIEIQPEKNKNDIAQSKYHVSKKEKMNLLYDLTKLHNPDQCMIFCNTRAEVDDVQAKLSKMGYPVRGLHGGMEQEDRTKVMEHFRRRKFRYLVATDVAARGIDIHDLSLVINYDVPEEAEIYVHRIGRTGRKETSGLALSLVTANEFGYMEAIEDLLGESVPLMDPPNQALLGQVENAFEDKLGRALIHTPNKADELNDSILKLHINAGKKTKMRAGDVVGTICSLEGLTADDIGIINIIDVSTFVEILNDKGEQVYEHLQHTPIKGRLRKVSRANA
ncbi:MAG TPA: RNA helicase [Clostridiales bacterium UBA8960]|nr:RNA helicase [Clostridiales bacterium UBA8960]